ncbi:MAG: glycosyltransferase family 4 protein [Planctomycetota bacterium]
MKVLHINTERTWRGGEQQTLYLADGLHRRGHDSHVLCPPGAPLGEKARSLGLETFEFSLRGELNPMAIGRIAKLLKKVKYDVVHMHTSHAHTLGCAAATITGQGLRIVSRRVDFSIHRHKLSVSGWKYRFGVDHFIAISKAVRDVLVKDGIPAERISIVYSGIDPGRFESVPPVDLKSELKLAREARLVGCVAHFGWHKAQEYLIRAIPELRRQVPEAVVLLIGHGDREELLREEAAKLSPEDREHLVFTGFRSDIPSVLHALDVFVMPSVLEGLCTSILDALVCERPVVASKVGGIPEIVRPGQTGVLVPPKEPVALAEGIASLLLDAQEARRLGRGGREMVEREFTYDATCEGTLAVYERLLADSRRRSERPRSHSRETSSGL